MKKTCQGSCSKTRTNSTSIENTTLSLSRKFNINIDFDGYKAYRNARGRPPPVLFSATNGISQASADTISIPESNNEAAGGIMPATTSSTEPPAPYPTSFAHIVELISNGQPVPGIKEIPSTVLEGQGTQSAKQRRKKPWENEENGMAEEVA
jgi:hypothetical protein